MVLFISAKLPMSGTRGLHQPLTKRVQALTQWHQTPQRPAHPRQRPQAGGGPVDRDSTSPRCERSCTTGSTQGPTELTWGIDHAASSSWKRGVRQADPDHRSACVVHRGDHRPIRGQSQAQGLYLRQLKDVRHLAVRPHYH